MIYTKCYLGSTPTTKTRRIAAQMAVSNSTVWGVLRKDGLYPYRFTPTQN